MTFSIPSPWRGILMERRKSKGVDKEKRVNEREKCIERKPKGWEKEKDTWWQSSKPGSSLQVVCLTVVSLLSSHRPSLGILWYETKDCVLWRGSSQAARHVISCGHCGLGVPLAEDFPLWVVALNRGHRGCPCVGKTHRSRWFSGKKNWIGRQNRCEDVHLLLTFTPPSQKKKYSGF